MILTGLAPDPRRPDYRLVEVDRGRFASLAAEDLELLDLRIGAPISKAAFARLQELAAEARYTLRATIQENGRRVREFTSPAFRGADLQEGRFPIREKWKPPKLWDLHTPENVYTLELALHDVRGRLLDEGLPVRCGLREFWIDGRDFYLNGTRLHLSAVPLDNAQVGAAQAGYAAAAFLRQDGWTVEYKAWDAGDPPMPKKVFAANGARRVRLAVDRWDGG